MSTILVFVSLQQYEMLLVVNAGIVKGASGQMLRSKEWQVVLNMFNYVKSENLSWITSDSLICYVRDVSVINCASKL